jgi:hypothetical protein
VTREERTQPSVVTTPRRGLLAACALGVLAFVVYLANLRAMGAADTLPARLLPFSIVREGNINLDEFHWLRANVAKPYFLRSDSAGHWHSRYPIVTPLLVSPLAAPFVWWSRAWQIDDGDARFRLIVTIFDRLAAAFLTAVSVALVYLGARCFAPASAATAAALVYAFGTNTWSTSSQSLWQHALTQLALAGAALCMLRREGRRTAVLSGVLLGLMVGARPQSVIVAAVITAFFWVERRRDFKFFVAGPVLMLSVVAAYNLFLLGRVTGGYSTRGVKMLDPERLLGLLLSPSRGLFVYCPLAILAFAALRRSSEEPQLLRYAAAAIVGYVLFYASFAHWWAGHSYGPRFFVDVMPLVALCALPAARRAWGRPLGRTFLIAGAAWSVVVQAVGVYCDDDRWNRWPVSVDAEPARLWEWSDPQIVRAARSGWHGGELAPLLRQLLTDRTPAPLVPLEWDNLQGTLEPLGAPPWRFGAGAGGWLHVRITNRTRDTVWPAFSDFGDLQVGVSAVWKARGVMVQQVGEFQALRMHLAPGATTDMREWIEAPKEAGQYDLELNLVQNLGNTGRFGGSTATVPVIVE